MTAYCRSCGKDIEIVLTLETMVKDKDGQWHGIEDLDKTADKREE